MTALERAKNMLATGNFKCVIFSGNDGIFSTIPGVSHLVSLCQSRGQDSFIGAAAADKVVGRATAFLYILLGFSDIYAGVISAPALSLLCENGINIEYGECVDNIINRQGNGICPFEEAVLGITDKNEAYDAILAKVRELNIKII